MCSVEEAFGSERARMRSTFLQCERLVALYDDGCRMYSTLLPVWTACINRGVLLMCYFISDEAQRCLFMLSAQSLLVVFDLADGLSSESSQLSRIDPLHYNKQYSSRHYRPQIRQKEKWITWNSVLSCNKALITRFVLEQVRAHLSTLTVWGSHLHFIHFPNKWRQISLCRFLYYSRLLDSIMCVM